MFNKSYFNKRYYVPRYFPPVEVVVVPVHPGGGPRRPGGYAQIPKLISAYNATAVIACSLKFDSVLRAYVQADAQIAGTVSAESEMRDTNAGKRAQQQIVIAALLKSIDI